jgi:hypothetical protein
MAEADIPEVPTFDIPKRLTDKSRPTPHINAETYSKNYEASIKDTDGFWGKVSCSFRLPFSFSVEKTLWMAWRRSAAKRRGSGGFGYRSSSSWLASLLGKDPWERPNSASSEKRPSTW